MTETKELEIQHSELCDGLDKPDFHVDVAIVGEQITSPGKTDSQGKATQDYIHSFLESIVALLIEELRVVKDGT